MSEDELVSAYADGRISRRSFIKRLVAIGVTVTSGIAYADLIAQPAMAKGPHAHAPGAAEGEHDQGDDDQGEDEHDQGDDDQGEDEHDQGDDDQGDDEDSVV